MDDVEYSKEVIESNLQTKDKNWEGISRTQK